MRIVTQEMVVLENASFAAGAQGWFSANARCPSCGEERQVTVPISDQGQRWETEGGCNSGHRWQVKASLVQ